MKTSPRFASATKSHRPPADLAVAPLNLFIKSHRAGSRRFVIFAALAAVGVLTVLMPLPAAAGTVTYTQQTGKYTASYFTPGGNCGFYNPDGTQMGMYAHNDGSKEAVAWRNFRIDDTTTGTQRSLQVGDVFSIRVNCSAAFGQIGFSLNAGGTQGTAYANNVSGSRLYFNADGTTGTWYVNRSSGTTTFTGAQVSTTFKQYQFAVRITSQTTADVVLTEGANTYNAYNLTMNGSAGANISAFSVYLKDDYNGSSQQNIFWQQTTSVNNSGVVQLGYNLTSGTFTPGLVTDGLDAASTSTASVNAVTVGGNAGTTVIMTQNNTFTGDLTINQNATLQLSGSGAVGSTPNIIISGGGTLDVSALTAALTLGNSQTLKASYSGSSATVKTTTGKGLTLGNNGVAFTAYNGSSVPLSVSGAGSLTIGSGNAVTVTTSAQLAAGSYKLIQIGSGNTTAVAGTAPSSVTVNGIGMVANGVASLRITSGELYLDICVIPPAVIYAPAAICPSFTGTATVTTNAGASYLWTVTNATIVGSATGTNLSFTAGASGANVGLNCAVTSGSGCVSNAVQVNVPITSSVNAAGAISGSSLVCQGTAGQTYSISAVTGASGYTWTVPSGASITAGANTTTITVTFGSTSGNITVTPTNACASGTPSTSAVTVSPTSVGGTVTASAATICLGNSVTLTNSGYTGTNQWQASVNSGAFTNVPGATSATYTASPALTTSYRVLVGSGTCSTTFSTTNTVTVSPVSVGGTVTASASTICSGSSSTLTNTGFTGNNQWQVSTDGVNFSPIANATNATVSVSPTQTSYYYSVVTSGVCSAANSTTNTVTVNTAPAITGQPQAITQCSGNSATFSVTNTGTAPSYQWRRLATGWSTGNAWALTNGGGGFFVGTSTNNGGGTGGIDTSAKAWGLYNSSSGTAEAVRNFTALSVGQVFQVDMDNGSINSGGPTVGFSLRNASGQNLVEFYFRGGQSFYEVNQSGSAVFTGLGFTANGVRVTVTVTASTTFSLTVVRLSDNATFGPYTGTFLNSGSISQFRGFNFNAGNGSSFDLFFNNLKAGPSATAPFFEDSAASYTTATWTNGSNLGNRPLTNSTTYANVTTSNLTVAAATSTEAASYDVVIYNSCGALTSSSATLTVNPTPIAAVTSVIHTNGAAVKVAFTNFTGNVAGVGVSTIAATTSGGQPLSIDGAYTMVYVPAATTNGETFTYTVTNASCSASGTATISVVAGNSGQTTGSINVLANLATVTFFGVPGTSYTVQRSTNAMATWQSIGTVTAPTNPPIGVINFTNDVSSLVPIPTSAFYRLAP